MKHTGGRWNPKQKNIYFIASSRDTLEQGLKCHPYILCAVNEINEQDLTWVTETAMNPDVTFFIDSGVFNLANSHAVKHRMTMDAALALAPDEIDGFDELYRKYCYIMRVIGDHVWGYIEIDQGGIDNKKKTRARLESDGFQPIPVYHPFNDGWDYFDELAEQYDRICFGNVVQADPETRKRLLATAWERKRKYPHLWIHLLGLTPNERLNAYPIDSCDSSAWLMHVRWSDRFHALTAGKTLSLVGHNVTYDRGSDPYAENGHWKARRLGGYDAGHLQRNWRSAVADYERALEIDPRNGLPAAV
jgi:hypothetical protein